MTVTYTASPITVKESLIARRFWRACSAVKSGPRFWANFTIWGKPIPLSSITLAIPTGGTGDTAPTIRRDLAVVTAAMNKAVKWKLIVRSPIEGYELPLPGKPRDRVLIDAEIESIRSHLTPTVQSIVSVALDTALRLSNARLLCWEWIDFKERIMLIPSEETKNGKPHVAVMTKKVRELLLRYRKESGKKSGHVFAGPTGKPYAKDSVSQAFRKAAKKAKVENVRFHDLRHTALTRAAAAGATGPDLMFMAGHSDLRMTARYTHQDLDRRRKVAAMLDARECHQSVTTEE